MATTKNLMDIDARWGQAERLCRDIAPRDLGDMPFCIVPQSRLPAGRFGNRPPQRSKGKVGAQGPFWDSPQHRDPAMPDRSTRGGPRP
jgi:hypothetical protein